jgi:hypothetical protein
VTPENQHPHYELLRKHWSQRNDSPEHRDMLRHFIASLRSQRSRPLPHVWLCIRHFTERAEREGVAWQASVHALQWKVCEECGQERHCLPLTLGIGKSSSAFLR